MGTLVLLSSHTNGGRLTARTRGLPSMAHLVKGAQNSTVVSSSAATGADKPFACNHKVSKLQAVEEFFAQISLLAATVVSVVHGTKDNNCPNPLPK